MLVACHPKRWWDQYVPEDEKRNRIVLLVKASRKLEEFFIQNKYAYKVLITKWFFSLMDKTGN